MLEDSEKKKGDISGRTGHIFVAIAKKYIAISDVIHTYFIYYELYPLFQLLWGKEFSSNSIVERRYETSRIANFFSKESLELIESDNTTKAPLKFLQRLQLLFILHNRNALSSQLYSLPIGPFSQNEIIEIIFLRRHFCQVTFRQFHRWRFHYSIAHK